MKRNPQIVTLCPECAETYRSKGIMTVPYKFKNATTQTEDRCKSCKTVRKGLAMFVVEGGV